jgi:hypothetical protein
MGLLVLLCLSTGLFVSSKACAFSSASPLTCFFHCPIFGLARSTLPLHRLATFLTPLQRLTCFALDSQRLRCLLPQGTLRCLRVCFDPLPQGMFRSAASGYASVRCLRACQKVQKAQKKHKTKQKPKKNLFIGHFGFKLGAEEEFWGMERDGRRRTSVNRL